MQRNSKFEFGYINWVTYYTGKQVITNDDCHKIIFIIIIIIIALIMKLVLFFVSYFVNLAFLNIIEFRCLEL